MVLNGSSKLYTAEDYIFEREYSQTHTGGQHAASYAHHPTANDSGYFDAGFLDGGADQGHGHPQDYPAPTLTSALAQSYNPDNFWDVVANGDMVDLIHDMQRQGEIYLNRGSDLVNQFPPELVARLTMPVEWRQHAALIGHEGLNVRLMSHLTQAVVNFPPLADQTERIVRGEGHAVETQMCGTVDGLEKCAYLVRSWAPVLIVLPIPDGVRPECLNPERDDIRTIESVCHVVINVYHPKRISVGAKFGGVADISGAVTMIGHLMDAEDRDAFLKSSRTDIILPEGFSRLLSVDVEATAAATQTCIQVLTEDPDANEIMKVNSEMYDFVDDASDEDESHAYEQHVFYSERFHRRRRPSGLYDQGRIVNDEKLIRIFGRPDDVLKARRLLLDALPVVLELSVPKEYILDQNLLERYGCADKITATIGKGNLYNLEDGTTLILNTKEGVLTKLFLIGRDILSQAWAHNFYTVNPINGEGVVPLSTAQAMVNEPRDRIYQRAERRAAANENRGSMGRRREDRPDSRRGGNDGENQDRHVPQHRAGRRVEERNERRQEREMSLPVREMPSSNREMPLPNREMPLPNREMPSPERKMPFPEREIPLPNREMTLPEKLRQTDAYFTFLHAHIPRESRQEMPGNAANENGRAGGPPPAVTPAAVSQQRPSQDARFQRDEQNFERRGRGGFFQDRPRGGAMPRQQGRSSYYENVQHQDYHGPGYLPLQSRVTGSFGQWVYPGGEQVPAAAGATAHGTAMVTVPHVGPHGRGATSAYASVTATALHLPGGGVHGYPVHGLTEEQTVVQRTTVYSFGNFDHDNGMGGQRYGWDQFGRGGGRGNRGGYHGSRNGHRGRRERQQYKGPREFRRRSNFQGREDRSVVPANREQEQHTDSQIVEVKNVTTTATSRPSTPAPDAAEEQPVFKQGSYVAALKKEVKPQPRKEEIATGAAMKDRKDQPAPEEPKEEKNEDAEQQKGATGKGRAGTPPKEEAKRMANDILETIFVSPLKEKRRANRRLSFRNNGPNQTNGGTQPRNDGSNGVPPSFRGRSGSNTTSRRPAEDEAVKEEQNKQPEQGRGPRKISEGSRGATGGGKPQEPTPAANRTTGKTTSCMKPPPAPKTQPTVNSNSARRGDGRPTAARGAQGIGPGGDAARNAKRN